MSDCPSERAGSVWEFSDVSGSLETAAGDLLAVPTKNWAFSGAGAWDSPSSSIRAQTVGAGKRPQFRMPLGQCVCFLGKRP